MRAALISPAVLVIAAIGSIFLLLDYVLPQFTPIFEQAGAELPASTRALMLLGQMTGAAAPWLLVIAVAAVLVAPRALAGPAPPPQVDPFLLPLPVPRRLLPETPAGPPSR